MIIVQLIVVLLILVQQGHPFLLLTTHEYSRNTPEMLIDMESASSFWMKPGALVILNLF